MFCAECQYVRSSSKPITTDTWKELVKWHSGDQFLVHIYYFKGFWSQVIKYGQNGAIRAASPAECVLLQNLGCQEYVLWCFWGCVQGMDTDYIGLGPMGPLDLSLVEPSVPRVWLVLLLICLLDVNLANSQWHGSQSSRSSSDVSAASTLVPGHTHVCSSIGKYRPCLITVTMACLDMVLILSASSQKAEDIIKGVRTIYT